MGLGAAPGGQATPRRGLYDFRGFWDDAGGQRANLAGNEIDIVQWVRDAKGPRSVASSGGRFVLEDNGETPDTQDALFEYDGMTALWSHREASRGRRAGGLEFFGTKGSMTVSRSGFEVFPDVKVDPESLIPKFQGHPGGGPIASDTKPEPYMAAIKEPGSSAQQLDLHVRN